MHFGGYDIKLCHILQKLGGHAPKNTELMTVDFSIWVVMLRNRTVPGGFGLLESKLGGYAPEWVTMLRNRAVPEGCLGGKIAILGGFAPENSTVPKPPKLGGHAPEHPIGREGHYCCLISILSYAKMRIADLKVVTVRDFVDGLLKFSKLINAKDDTINIIKTISSQIFN